MRIMEACLYLKQIKIFMHILIKNPDNYLACVNSIKLFSATTERQNRFLIETYTLLNFSKLSQVLIRFKWDSPKTIVCKHTFTSYSSEGISNPPD